MTVGKTSSRKSTATLPKATAEKAKKADAPKAAKASPFSKAGSSFEPAKAKAAAPVKDGLFDREILDGVDGYVAFDTQDGRFLSGDTGGVKTSDDHLSPLFPRGLGTLLALGVGGETVKLSVKGGNTIESGKTDGHGFEPTTVEELQQLGPKGLHPKKGGLIHIQVEAEGRTADEKVLALPRSYDGPIFVSDIDDTLRPTKATDVLKGTTQAPIPGAKELLEGVAAKGVPIIYLSAGPQRIGTLNDDFLAQLPDGALLARGKMDLLGFSPFNSDQAQSQGDYKAQRLAELRRTFPNAKIFGFGDDKYGDANAYAAAGATAYIHDVRPGDDNIPKNFQGTITADYTPDFRAKVLGDLDAAIAKSDSFK